MMWSDFWTWLAGLSQGSASFVGTLAGSSFGLIAIVIGALVNATLNRRRDDRLREEDRIALASTLYAELAGLHRSLIENAQHLTDKPPDPDAGFVVPEPSIKLLTEMLPKVGLLKGETIRKVMDAYVLTEAYLEQMILAGGTLHEENLPQGRQLVYLNANLAEFVTELNRARAKVVNEAMQALAPYLK